MTAQNSSNKSGYTIYKSSIANHNIIMSSGKRIQITDHKYITNNEDEIKFLDAEIRSGFPYLKKISENAPAEVKVQQPHPSIHQQSEIIDTKLPPNKPIQNPQIQNSQETVKSKLSPASTAILSKLSADSISKG
jgi:DNA-binding MltR family transcriptional regulator